MYRSRRGWPSPRRDAWTGARVHGRSAKGDRTGLVAHDQAPVSMSLRVAGMLLVWRLCGDHGHSPFFDAGTGEPSASQRILGEYELREVERARDKG